jgi:hypothetical protein
LNLQPILYIILGDFLLGSTNYESTIDIKRHYITMGSETRVRSDTFVTTEAQLSDVFRPAANALSARGREVDLKPGVLRYTGSQNVQTVSYSAPDQLTMDLFTSEVAQRRPAYFRSRRAINQPRR